MTVDTKNLRVLAEAANVVDWYTPDDVLLSGVELWKNARFIAACSPDVVLGMLDALERKDALLRQALEAFDAVAGKGKLCNAAVEAINKELTP